MLAQCDGVGFGNKGFEAIDMTLEVVEDIKLDIVFVVFENSEYFFLDETIASFEEKVKNKNSFIDYFLILFLVDEVEGQTGGT